MPQSPHQHSNQHLPLISIWNVQHIHAKCLKIEIFFQESIHSRVGKIILQITSH